MWRLLEDYSVTYTDKARPDDVLFQTAPAGLRSDGPSIPWYARWLIDRNGKLFPCGIIHDHLYNSGPMDRRDADRFLRDHCRVMGVGRLRVWLIYWTVRVWGQAAWDRCRS